MPWPDLERDFVDWIPATFPGVKAGVETTDKLDANLPFVRVVNLGGTDNGITDFVRLTFDVFAASYTQAKAISQQIRDGAQPRVRVGSATLDTVRTDASPHKVPWDNVSVSRVLATYQFSVRR